MFGNIAITAGLIFSVFTIIMYYFSFKGYNNTLKYARLGYHSMTIFVIIASALLMHAILTHQYEYKYVFNYSNAELPTGLLMSTFYAGQEGSFMLWLLFTSIVGLVLLEYTSKREDLEPRVMMIFTLAAAFLLLMVSPMLKNPFSFIWADPTFVEIKHLNQSFLSMSFLQNFIFQDPGSGQSFVRLSPEFMGTLSANGIAFEDFLIKGKGLNPLLQNFWMQIHPPILFVGFSMATVPFAFAFAALLKNEYKDWVKQALPWVLSGTMVLGLAIMLGGYWAYGVLGWGGYWGWDPVENSSLVPWIVGVASVHTLLIQKKTQAKGGTGRFGKTNLILAIMTYLLVLYSTFLTRSGILGDASVHSFAEPGMLVYWLLILFVGFFTLLGIGGIIYRWKYLEMHFNYEEDLLSRELALFTGAIALIASALIITVGTSAPIFGTSVEISFYNELNLPIAIIIGVLNGFSLLLKWKQTKGESILKNSKFAIISTLTATLLMIVLGGLYDFMLILLALSVNFTIFVNAEIAYKIWKGKKNYIGAYIAHIGFAVFLLGALASGSFAKDEQLDLAKGESAEVFGHSLTFLGYTPIENGTKYAFNIEVDKNGSKNIVSPVMYIAEFNNSLMREPDIWNRLTDDFYISPVGYEDGSSRSSDTGQSIMMRKGETKQFNGLSITFDSFNFPPEAMAAMQSGGDFYIGAKMTVSDGNRTVNLEPKLQNKNGQRSFVPDMIDDMNLKVNLENLDASGNVQVIFSTLDETTKTVLAPKEVLTIEASIKPFINLVWAGVLIVVLGFSIAAVRRTKESRA